MRLQVALGLALAVRISLAYTGLPAIAQTRPGIHAAPTTPLKHLYINQQHTSKTSGEQMYTAGPGLLCSSHTCICELAAAGMRVDSPLSSDSQTLGLWAAAADAVASIALHLLYSMSQTPGQLA